MSEEAVLALAYAGFLLLVAEGVRRFVRRKAVRDRLALDLGPGDSGLPWPHWEALQLRRAVVAVMPSVAAVILLVVLVRNHSALEVVTLGGLLGVAVIFTAQALKSVRGEYVERRPPA